MTPLTEAASRTTAQKTLQMLEEHLMTWNEPEAYAGGWVVLVASLTAKYELAIQGIEFDDKKPIEGQFVRVDFSPYWVFSPGNVEIPLRPLEYRKRMAAWLEQIPMLEKQRQGLLEALDGVQFLDDVVFEDFKDMLLADPATAFEVRRDLVARLPDLEAVVAQLDGVANAYAMQLSLSRWQPESGMPSQ